MQRYKELFDGRGGGGPQEGEDLPYEIETHLTEIDTGKIDNVYMNLNFERYLRALEQPNITEAELSALLNDLSTSFATLPQEQQEFAEIFMHKVQSGTITLEQGKTCRDYITELMTTVKEQRISHLAEAFGLNRDLLHTMMSMHINEQNIDEFGRFSQLQNTIDVEKAQAYFLEKTGEEIDIFDVNVAAGNLLRKFILQNGFDI